jgi:hypothetical protein
MAGTLELHLRAVDQGLVSSFVSSLLTMIGPLFAALLAISFVQNVLPFQSQFSS